MFTKMKAGRFYILIGLSAYLLFVLAGMPASFVWNKVSSALSEETQGVSGVIGTVWQGHANIRIEGERHQLDWHISPRALWKAQFEVDVTVDNEQLHIDTTLFISPFALGIYNARGNIDQRYVNRYVRDMGVEISSPILIDLKRIEWSDEEFVKADGRIVWDGGEISYRASGRPAEANLPALRGVFSIEDSALEWTVSEAQSEATLLQARLNNNGLGEVIVQRHLLDLLGQRWAANSQPDDIVFEVSQSLWN